MIPCTQDFKFHDVVVEDVMLVWGFGWGGWVGGGHDNVQAFSMMMITMMMLKMMLMMMMMMMMRTNRGVACVIATSWRW